MRSAELFRRIFLPFCSNFNLSVWDNGTEDIRRETMRNSDGIERMFYQKNRCSHSGLIRIKYVSGNKRSELEVSGKRFQ
jgi:hypothetical protein